MQPIHPGITIPLSNSDGNAFMLLGICQRAAKAHGLPPEEIESFRKEAMSGDYEHLLQTVMRWFDCS